MHLSAVPTVLRRPVTVAWTGQADTLVHRIAAGIGYAYRQVGPHPAVPVILVMRMHAVPAVRALQEIGARVAREAIVRVDPNTRTITYQSASGWQSGRTQ